MYIDIDNPIERTESACDFPDFDENTRTTTFFTTGTTGVSKGCYYSHRQLVLHTMAIAGWFGTAPAQGRIHREDVYMPIAPMFHVRAWGVPYAATLLGLKQVYPGRYEAALMLKLIRDEGVTFSHCVPTLLQMLLSRPEAARDIDGQTALRVRTGQPFMLCDVRIVDDEMKARAHDGQSQGEVVFRSLWLTQGYLKEPETSRSLWRGGYLHSGGTSTV